MKKIIKHNKERGFTITELMIVTALLGLVLSGMYNMFVHQQKSYTVQDDVAVMQQNVRVGLSYMVKGIRMAGYKPETIPYDISNPPIPTPQKPAPSVDVPGQTFTDGDSEDIEEATASAITLQADIDNDAITETVRYALSGTDLTMEVWEWNAATSSWGASSGLLIIAEDIENLAFTYTLLADNYGYDNDADDDGNDGVDEEGELKTWDFAVDGALNNAERKHIRQVSVMMNSMADVRDPDYIHPDEGDGFRRRTLTSDVDLRNL